jgi:hypothetical protein
VEERLAAAAGYIRLSDFSPTQALELRLAAVARRDAAVEAAEGVVRRAEDATTEMPERGAGSGQ